jgi:hypothetical protein
MTPPLAIAGNEFFPGMAATPLPSDATKEVPLPINDSVTGIHRHKGFVNIR